MTTGGGSTERDPIDLLAEQFLQRHRRGDRVPVDAFAAEHPAHEQGLKDLLPTLLALEQVKRDRESTGSDRARVAVPALEQVGDFRIVRELGRGGMGVVFEAVQESLGRKVALKVLPQASLLTGNQLERFRREAQIAAQLHHSNIVPVFGSGESAGYHWYAMQFITGQSLDRWRHEQAAAPPRGSGAWRARARFVARIGAQAASALHYAHGEGTLHRDVKPANLLLESNDHLWVTDFGLAKALEAEGLTHSGDLLGTLQYMAPEQFLGRYDVRSEVYALGVTLYELLVLRPAFAAKTRSELMETIRTRPPEGLLRLCPDVPEDLVIVIEKAMARDAADRYGDAHELEQDLQAFLEDRPIAARRQSVVRTTLRWCRRNRALAALAACTLLAVLAAGITGWVAYGITDDALGRAKASGEVAAQQSVRAESNLKLALTAFGEMFDAVVGRDPALALDEDPDTGEQTVIVRPVLEAGDIELMRKMLAFYELFAAQNIESQSLRYETARAYRRAGAIHARLGKPDNLEQAAKAYEAALAHFASITDRDVRREVAGVQVDFAQLEQRRRDPAAASVRLREALRLLESEPLVDNKNVRFERAQVHFLLARGPGRRPGGPGGPPGRPPDDRNHDAEHARVEPRAELLTALSLVNELLADEPDNQKCRALRARCLLLSSQRPPRRSDAGDRSGDAALVAAREQARAAGIQIFRELVAKNPDADAYRFELCEALIGDRRRDMRRAPGRRDDPEPPRVAPEEIDVLREARALADKLMKEQPLFQEYVALRGRAGSLLGWSLHNRCEVVPEAERPALQREAESELRAALQLELQLVSGEHADPRFVRQVVETRHNLGELLLATGRRAEAIAEGKAIVDLLVQQVEALEPGAGQGGAIRFMMGDEGLAPRFLMKLDVPELRQRLRESTARGRPDRGGSPSEPRGGR
ncbi:MAG TPA: serine/threonine-protein kinase [Planctomycetota bacterium]|nr:serine/threonine-protein kinase [Planctomycetota bacterium]